MARLAGVDIGGTKTLVVVVDRDAPAKLLAEHRIPTPDDADDLLEAIQAVLAHARRDVEADGVQVTAAGVGVAGLVDREGTVRLAPHLPFLRGKPVGALLSDQLGLPVRVDNDATCTAWGEQQAGAARGATDSLCVTLGTGIGAGIVAGGEVVRGAHGFAGEAGHMVVDPTGPPCPCGRHGCWERFGSGSGLGRLAREAAEAGRLDRALELAGGDLSAVMGEHVARAAREGDVAARDLLATFAWWVALGVANLVTLLDPRMVVIGGGLIEIGDLLMEPLREHFGNLVMARDARPDTRIVPALLGERAGAIGAALLAG